MLSALSNLGSRLFRGASGARTAAAAVQASPPAEEWASLSLDPELGLYGSARPAAETATEVTLEPAPAGAVEVQPALEAVGSSVNGTTLDSCDPPCTAASQLADADPGDSLTPAAMSADAGSPTSSELDVPAASSKKRRSKKLSAVKSGAASASKPAKAPRGRSGALRGSWKLPGLDGFEPLGANNAVEDYELDLCVDQDA